MLPSVTPIAPVPDDFFSSDVTDSVEFVRHLQPPGFSFDFLGSPDRTLQARVVGVCRTSGRKFAFRAVRSPPSRYLLRSARIPQSSCMTRASSWQTIYLSYLGSPIEVYRDGKVTRWPKYGLIILPHALSVSCGLECCIFVRDALQGEAESRVWDYDRVTILGAVWNR